MNSQAGDIMGRAEADQLIRQMRQQKAALGMAYHNIADRAGLPAWKVGRILRRGDGRMNDIIRIARAMSLSMRIEIAERQIEMTVTP